MRAAAVLIGLACAATLFALATPLDDHRPSAPFAGDIGKLETLLAARLSAGLWPPALPPGYPVSAPDRAHPLDSYVRHYALVTLRSEEDLPFTTIDSSSGDPRRFTGRRIVGVLAMPGDVDRPAGVVVGSRDQLPAIFHRGCSIVNVAYDPEAERLVSAWCNVP